MFQCSSSVQFSIENQRALQWVIAIGSVFLVSQIIGGIVSHSLAVLLDASHVFSDLLGFGLSLYILHLKQKPPTETFTYGFQRADVVGGLASIMLIWLVTGMLILEGVYRIITPQAVEGGVMFIMGWAGLLQASIIAYLLKDHEHGHSHGGHGHSHGGHSHGGHSHGGHSHGEHEEYKDIESDHLLYSPSQLNYQTCDTTNTGEHENLTMYSAYLHALTDMVQSLGVILAGTIIWIFPTWTRVDPLCTFLFAFLVLKQTIPTLKEIVYILMQASPPVDYEGLESDLLNLSFVKKIEHVHVWRNGNQTIGTAHLCLSEPLNTDLLGRIKQIFSKYGIDHPTIQCVL